MKIMSRLIPKKGDYEERERERDKEGSCVNVVSSTWRGQGLMRGDARQGVGCKEETDHRRLNNGDVFPWCARCGFNHLKGRCS